MNITCEISTDVSNSFDNSTLNNTNVDHVVQISLIGNILSILISFPINSYVIWLLVTGTGNGLAAEFFILNLSVSKMFYCIECVMICVSYEFKSTLGVTYFLDGITITGCPLFESLICVERYLAVVHPVTFLKYKPLRYRLMCSAVVWVLSFFSCICVFMLYCSLLFRLYSLFYFAQFLLFLFIQLFCCLAVLRALKQSGPGEREREREEENNMKKRAFNFILITTVATVILNIPQITLVLIGWRLQSKIFLNVSYLFFLCVGLVQPLLFLYRVGKLSCIKKRMKLEISI